MSASTSCPGCGTPLPDAPGNACPRCNALLPHRDHRSFGAEHDPDATRLEVAAASVPARRGQTPTPTSLSTGWLSSSGGIDHGRFPPGALLGGRYRIIQRLGRGGMGEVYRADDLKLGQPVALKFLPPDVDRDPARLTQLHTEVRLARQVSHPNVCRVYDINEVEGSTFLSMEFVDGEDLASLLRRIGRFPEDRALEIARQICAGLAAAHERNVVHRDLKPANIMLDGAGKVRITDFGLAGLAGEALRAGTPAYMAPEQLAGNDVTARSDIYSLGLVLYEIFTGQRALEGGNLAELIHKREHSGIAPPTTVVTTLDPKIEAAIMRCLKPAVDERPPSALSVAAALPGGDPLAAALAAGETPSPEMVAAAGRSDALHPAIGLSLVAIVIGGLVACAAISDRFLLYTRVPLQRSLDSLQDRARDILAALGYETAGQHSARGLQVNFDVIRHIQNTSQAPNRWDALDRRSEPVIQFWYRSSPQPLVPPGYVWNPSANEPPFNIAGMTRMKLDDTGKLVEFEAVPARGDDPSARSNPAPWPALFKEAGLEMAQFTPVTPVLRPLNFASERAAWEGPLPGGLGAILHVEAAAQGGLPIGFRVTGPAEPIVPGTTPPLGQPGTWRLVSTVLATAVMLGTLILARSNLRAGRGDRRGASRLFGIALVALSASWAISARHYPSVTIENSRLLEFIAHAVFSAGLIWLFYIALEPYVRRFSPGILITWTRVLAGQFNDAQVGRDVLIGAVVGVSIALVGISYVFVPQLLGQPPGQPRVTNAQFLLGTSAAIGAILRLIPNNLQNALFVAIAFGVGRALTGRVWGGAVLAAGMLGVFVLGDAGGPRTWIVLTFVAAFVIPLVATLIYCGLLSVTIAFFVYQTINNSPLTLDLSLPHATGAIWGLSVVLALTGFGFFASRGGQPLFGRWLEAG